jgi:hypothetical protein
MSGEPCKGCGHTEEVVNFNGEMFLCLSCIPSWSYELPNLRASVMAKAEAMQRWRKEKAKQLEVMIDAVAALKAELNEGPAVVWHRCSEERPSPDRKLWVWSKSDLAPWIVNSLDSDGYGWSTERDESINLSRDGAPTHWAYFDRPAPPIDE